MGGRSLIFVAFLVLVAAPLGIGASITPVSSRGEKSTGVVRTAVEAGETQTMAPSIQPSSSQTSAGPCTRALWGFSGHTMTNGVAWMEPKFPGSLPRPTATTSFHAAPNRTRKHTLKRGQGQFIRMPCSTNSCFVHSALHWGKTQDASHLDLGSPALMTPRAASARHTPTQRKGKLASRLLCAGLDRGSSSDEDRRGNGDQQLILPSLLMYSLVPFVPSVVLSSMNDDYLTMKEQFKVAAASLSPGVATDSIEYGIASAAYDETMQKLFVLLVSKRLALYFLATLATAYAGWRASMSVAAIRNGSVGGPGEALDKLNREILRGEMEDEDDRKRNGEEQLFATLVDDNPQATNVGNALAVVLPLVLGGSLAFSWYFLSITASSDGSSGAVQEIVPYVPYLSALPSAILCVMFLATEFRWALPSNVGTPESKAPDSSLLCMGNVLALGYVAAAYAAKQIPTIALGGLTLDLWPLQNGCNIALAATVARALSPFLFPLPAGSNNGLKSIRTISLALVGLTLFDAISTFGTVANAVDASTVGAAAATAQPTMSVMESVARSKLVSWQPGLLEIILGHGNSQATEALGLGDVVFPSILVTWGIAADTDAKKSREDGLEAVQESNNLLNYPYASASILGYILGSVATEIVGSFSLLGPRSGLPALVFLVPSMLGCISLTALTRNELDDVWGTAASSNEV